MWAIVAKRIADEFVKKFTKSIKEADYSELRNIVAEGLQKVSDSLATDSSSKKREIVLYSKKKLAKLSSHARSNKRGWMFAFGFVFLVFLQSITSGPHIALDIILVMGLLLIFVFRIYPYKLTADSLNRFSIYYACFDGKEISSWDELTSAVNLPYDTVLKDFQFYIQEKVLLETHYDKKNVYLSNVAYQRRSTTDLPPKPKPQTKVPEQSEAVTKTQKFLDQIEAYNKEIDNPGVSAQLDYMRLIVVKIQEYIKKHPEAEAKTERMTQYYLPMTMKLWKNYQDLDDDMVSGNNRKHSKEEIENVLKKVNEGFNALYDELYQDTSMDIHADISVLETLLAQDGLTDQKMKGGQENGNE